MKFICLFLTFSIFFSCSQIQNVRTPSKILRPVWSQNLDPISDSGNLPIALQAPLIYEGILFAGDNRGFFRAYDLDRKIEIWNFEDKTTYHSKPIGYKNFVLYGTVSGRLISRQIENGVLNFEVDLGASIDSPIFLHQGRIFVQLRNHQIMSVDAETGKILWGFKKSVSNLTTLQRTSMPIVYKNKVLAGFADGTIGALSLEEGVLLYEVKVNSGNKFLDIDSELVIQDQTLIVTSVTSGITFVNSENGNIIKKTEWVSLTKASKIDDKFLFGLNSGELLVLDKDYNEVKKISVSKSGITSIHSFKNHLIVSNLRGELIALDKQTFQLLDRFEFGHSYSSIVDSVDVNEGFLAVLSSRNRLFLFQ